MQSFIFNQGLGNDASVVAIILHLWMLLTGLKPVKKTLCEALLTSLVDEILLHISQVLIQTALGLDD